VLDYPKLLLRVGAPLGWDESFKNNYELQAKYLENVNIKKRNKGKNYQFLDVLEHQVLFMLLNKEIAKKDEEEHKICSDKSNVSSQ